MATNKNRSIQKQTPVKPPTIIHPPEKSLSKPLSTTGSWIDTISKRKYFIPAVIFFLCLLLYGNTIFNNYALDDEFVTYKNEYILKGFSAFKDIFDKGSKYGYSRTIYAQEYRPLTLLSFMIEVAIFGLNPHLSHFINLLLFAFTVVILYYFLQKILKNYNHAIIVAATLLFAFHPIHTEVVASIKSRDEILGLLFGLLSFYFIMLYSEVKNTMYYIYSLTVFFAALLCKESCYTYVAIIPLLLYFFTSSELKWIVVKTIPYLGLVVICLIIRLLVLQSMTFTGQIPIKDNALMATLNNSVRIATSFVILAKYIYMTIIPHPLSWDYSYNQIPLISWMNIKPILSVVICAALIVFMILGIKRKSIFSFLIAWFFITIFLSSNLVIRIAVTFAERFLYAPSLSFCIALPVILGTILKLNTFQPEWKKKFYFYIPVLLLLVIYSVIVIPRNRVWKNHYTLFISGVQTSPNSERTHGALATMYFDSATILPDTAIKRHYYSLSCHEFNRVAEIYDKDAMAYFYLALCYSNNGLQDSAIQSYKKTIELEPIKSKDNVEFMDALMNIGILYYKEKNFILANRYDSLVLKYDPQNRSVLNNMSSLHTTTGGIYFRKNELDSALEEVKIALLYDSNYPDANGDMGLIYQAKGNMEKAKYYFKKADSLKHKIK